MLTKVQLKASIKRVTPAPAWRTAKRVRSAGRKLKNRAKLRWIAYRAPRLHDALLTQYQGERPIRVAFLMSNLASWKVDTVFTRMLDDLDFEPIIILSPVTSGILSQDAEHAANIVRDYVSSRKYPHIDLIDTEPEPARKEIKRLDPHIVFFTNPHSLAPRHLHDELLGSHLTCYVPYNHEVMSYGDQQEQYNKVAHNYFWRIFAPQDVTRQHYANHRLRGENGVVTTGFPACEPLIEPIRSVERFPWKKQERTKKRVIYAPHWLWRHDIKMATINHFGEEMMRIAERYSNDIQWALRPHPMLRPKLTSDPKWGPEKTHDFFAFWSESFFSQINEGDYVSMFRTSDALIHDSGSSLAEYMYVRKPSLYLLTEDTGGKYFNAFGRAAFNACNKAQSIGDVERFLDQLLSGEQCHDKVEHFFGHQIRPLMVTPPSKKICQEIKQNFGLTQP